MKLPGRGRDADCSVPPEQELPVPRDGSSGKLEKCTQVWPQKRFLREDQEARVVSTAQKQVAAPSLPGSQCFSMTCGNTKLSYRFQVCRSIFLFQPMRQALLFLHISRLWFPNKESVKIYRG